ncbi:MAG: hypothetical protein JXR25_09455 [Pontiellaceae bacterium]|nr:hypothetical protein [Pontiellaceae bacterium]MBN2785042.1 hypothetical protein [Pontiellaceae bacterium]
MNAKEWGNAAVTVGGFRRFAEMDYDDMEDFGRINDAQDLGDDKYYGSDAFPWAFFAEANTSLGAAALNPFIYIHDGYAHVYGLDTDSKMKLASEATLGLKADGYAVHACSGTGRDDAWAWTAAPYFKTGPFTLSAGYIGMSGEDGGTQTLTKPLWMRDYMPCTDQVLPFNNQAAMQGLDSVYGKIKYSNGAFWTHFLVADHSYNASSIGTQSTEIEYQAGYDFGHGFNLNLRLFDCEFDGNGAGAIDYQKIEVLARYTF